MSARQHQLFAVTYWLLQAATLFMFLIVGAIVLALFAFLGASAFGLLTVAVFRAIHQMPLVSAWLLLGLLPGILGLYLTL